MRYNEQKFPVLSLPQLSNADIDLLTDYCALMGYILDIDNDKGHYFIRDGKSKAFIQKDYWNNVTAIYAVKNRFTPKNEWENITENMIVIERCRSATKLNFFERYLKPMFGIIFFNPTFLPNAKNIQ